jgi:16S rRNA (uracil1498-N3)-methyltransferase
MECFIVRESDIYITTNTLILRGDEARHAVRVLRISEGEQLMATTLQGFCYRAKCRKSGQVSKNEWECECSIEEILPEHNEPEFDVQLIQGITQQQSKLEEIAEKVTELGVRSIAPIYSKRTEKRTINAERLERIIQTACKQTYRARMPMLNDITGLADALKHAKEEGRKMILLHESAPLEDSLTGILATLRQKKLSIIIGPEGGFEESEVFLASNEYGAAIASLGKRRLRAETAAVSAIAITMALGFSS